MTQPGSPNRPARTATSPILRINPFETTSVAVSPQQPDSPSSRTRFVAITTILALGIAFLSWVFPRNYWPWGTKADPLPASFPSATAEPKADPVGATAPSRPAQVVGGLTPAEDGTTAANSESAAGRPPAQALPQATLPMFETESYRLLVESVTKAGSTVTIGLRLESVRGTTIHFVASGWYLLDENGQRWDTQESAAEIRALRALRHDGGSSPNFVEVSVDLVPGTRVRGEIVFSATADESGRQFTLVGKELTRRPRDVVIRGLRAGA